MDTGSIMIIELWHTFFKVHLPPYFQKIIRTKGETDYKDEKFQYQCLSMVSIELVLLLDIAVLYYIAAK